MRMLIRIVFVIFIANGIDCLGKVCDNCCDCFKEKDKNEEIKEYKEIKDEGNNTAESLVNNVWYKAKENKTILKIFKKKDDSVFPSKDNGDKILIKLNGKNNPKIPYQNEKKVPLNLKGKKYAFFEIKTKKEEETVYLYCSDVESSENDNGIFEYMDHISISVIACDTTNVKNMRYMFYECSSLTKLDLKNFNTTNVTDMHSMFYECSSLTELDLKNFNTTKVTDMEYMFSDCSNLKELDLNNFDTTNVTYMNRMFCKCSSLKNLKIGNNFNTKPNVEYMFFNCNNLPEDIRSDLNNVEGIINFFKGKNK